jgi:hypothetical protein
LRWNDVHMAGKKKNPQWRKVFLRAVARTGNARASAVEAGIDVATAYNHRIKDPAFWRQWASALATFRARPAGRGGKPGKAGEMVLRRTKHGDKLVRAAPGRWCARVEESFFDGLELTGCVRTAAAAAGISTKALYARRKVYPEFAERWDEVAARAALQLPALLHTAAVVSLGPEPSTGSGRGPRRGRGRLPRVSVDQAIRISRIKGPGAGDGRRGGIGPDRRAASREELEQELTKLLGMLKRRNRKTRLAQGWTEAGEDVWIPPGWVFIGPGKAGAGAEASDPGGAEERESFEDFVRGFGTSGRSGDSPPAGDGDSESEEKGGEENGEEENGDS